MDFTGANKTNHESPLTLPHIPVPNRDDLANIFIVMTVAVLVVAIFLQTVAKNKRQ